MVDSDRDLGALMNQLLRAVVAREEPILAAHDLTMWDYVILSALAAEPAPTQTRLATLTGRDKTRLIGHLDRLDTAGLVRRTPDPDDRRNRIVATTPRGTRTWSRCRTAIRAMEDDLLAAIPASRRDSFRRDLAALAAAVRD